jgi:hypothetical protein
VLQQFLCQLADRFLALAGNSFSQTLFIGHVRLLDLSSPYTAVPETSPPPRRQSIAIGAANRLPST